MLLWEKHNIICSFLTLFSTTNKFSTLNELTINQSDGFFYMVSTFQNINGCYQ